MRTTIAIKEVKVGDRMRKDLGDIHSLAVSIKEKGLIQPIVLDPNFNLIAGERRLRAHEMLGLEAIDYVLYNETSESVRKEIEFCENFWRKSMTWQEECLGILDIYRTKKREGALTGITENWHLIVSNMFGMSIGTVNYIIVVARKLEEELKLPEEKRRYHQFQSAAEAYRLGILADKNDADRSRLAELSKLQVNSAEQVEETRLIVEEVVELQQNPTLLDEERRRYESNPLNKDVPFDAYWEEKQRFATERQNTIHLSNRFINGDCIDYMLANEGAFDHIITDPPYGIDMDNLNQQNSHGGMRDIDRVEEAHQVDENVSLLDKFFRAAFHCTKESAFVVVCGDQMQWQYMYDLAISAGFAVQRWPLIWRKVNQSVMNNCSQYNTTKDFEIIMVCRKPAATLANKRNSSIIDASNSQAVKETGHPFAKPYELTRELIQLVSLEGQLILEPFAGCGSLALEIIRNNRQVIAVEKETHHYNQLLENVKRHYLSLNPKLKFK